MRLFTLPSTVAAPEVRQSSAALGSAAVELRRTARDLLPLRFIKTAKRHWFTFCIGDSTGRQLTYGKALTGSLLLARWLRKHHPDDAMIGLLLPASVAGALANIATLLAAKVPVNLHFTAGQEALTSALQQCAIRTIVTSRAFLARTKIAELEGTVYIEDMLQDTSAFAKVRTALLALLVPTRLLEGLVIRRLRSCSNARAWRILSAKRAPTCVLANR